ncbi:transmembrane protein, putative [Bodo saltans]|uniref:Transmembrane protein, putative n=1 Tax=Bodo saltans TaxID=75058 RepID=A0A0S4JK34_BODSA|nr:transmembrane protein, putative [Bodo saltans]|eukprot:CUG90938.1 transmembrane protein, putative [Bodo saltans]
MDITWYSEKNVEAQTVILICGWPDTSDIFCENIIPLLIRGTNNNNHRDSPSLHALSLSIDEASGPYRVVGLTLPSYSQNSARKAFGWSLSALVDLFDEAIQRIMDTYPATSRFRHLAPILICHDWGCTIALECLTKRPFLFERIVCLDVSGHPAGDCKHAQSWTNVSSWLLGASSAVSFKAMVHILWYQSWIMMCYLLHFVIPFLADWLIVLLCRLAGRPEYRRFVGGDTPILGGRSHNNAAVVVKARGDMGWPYFSLWWGLLIRLPLTTHRYFVPVHVPILYLYGERKPFQFHTDQWIHHIDEKRVRDGMSLALGIRGGGHWFYAAGGLPQKLALGQIEQFLATQRKVI